MKGISLPAFRNHNHGFSHLPHETSKHDKNSKKCTRRNLLYAIFRNQISKCAVNRIFCTRRNSTAFAHAFLKGQKSQSKHSHKNAFAKYRSHLRTAVQQPARQQKCRSQVIFDQIFLVSFEYLFSLLGGAIWKIKCIVILENFPSLFECTSFLRTIITFLKFCASMHMPRLHPSRLVESYGYRITGHEFGTDIYIWRIPNCIQTMLIAFGHDGILKSFTYSLNMAIRFHFARQAMSSYLDALSSHQDRIRI